MELYYVASYPKSGATWFRLLMYALHHGKIEDSNKVQQFYPEVPNQEDLISRNIAEKDRSFIKSHFAYNPQLPFIEKATAIIFIVRNPFNCMLSKFDHYKYEGVDWVSKQNGLNRFCSSFIEEANWTEKETPEKIHGGWNYHTTSWMNANLKIPFVVIKYENLVKDTAGELRRIINQLNWNFDDKQVANAVELTTFEKTQKLEEQELKKETPGMFYSKKRRDNFMADQSLRFVKMGKKRDAWNSLPEDIILEGKLAFYEGMNLLSYY